MCRTSCLESPQREWVALGWVKLCVVYAGSGGQGPGPESDYDDIICAIRPDIKYGAPRAKVVWLKTKQTAETAHLTMRIECELGHVDEATMDRARSLYARFEMAQKAYVAALELWEQGARQPDLEDATRGSHLALGPASRRHNAGTAPVF